MDEEQIILDNIYLIPYCIKDLGLYWYNEDGYQALYDDGLVGLINAAKSYDRNKDIKVSSFLYPCIKNEILRGLKSRNAEKRKTDNTTISLNDKAKDGVTELVELIGNDIDIDNLVERNITLEAIKKILNDESNKKWSEAFKLYYGIGCKPMTLEDVAKIINVTPESARTRVIKMTNKIKLLINEYESHIILEELEKKKSYGDLSFYVKLYGDLLDD